MAGLESIALSAQLQRNKATTSLTCRTNNTSGSIFTQTEKTTDTLEAVLSGLTIFAGIAGIGVLLYNLFSSKTPSPFTGNGIGCQNFGSETNLTASSLGASINKANQTGNWKDVEQQVTDAQDNYNSNNDKIGTIMGEIVTFENNNAALRETINTTIPAQISQLGETRDASISAAQATYDQVIARFLNDSTDGANAARESAKAKYDRAVADANAIYQDNAKRFNQQKEDYKKQLDDNKKQLNELRSTKDNLIKANKKLLEEIKKANAELDKGNRRTTQPK